MTFYARIRRLQAQVAAVQGNDWQESVIAHQTTPPGLPAPGDRYLVETGGTGAWSGHDDEIAVRDGAAWVFTVPNEGFALTVEATDETLRYDGSNWDPFGGGGAAGFFGDGDAVLRTPSTNGAELTPGDLNLVGGTGVGDPGNPSFNLPASEDLDLTPLETVVYTFVVVSTGDGEVATINTQGDDTFANGTTTYEIQGEQEVPIAFVFFGRGIFGPGGLWFGLRLESGPLVRSTWKDHGEDGGTLTFLIREAANHRVKLNGNSDISLAFAQAPQGDGTRGRIVVEQATAGGATVLFNDAKWPGGVAPVLTVGADARDVFEYELVGVDVFMRVLGQDFQ